MFWIYYVKEISWFFRKIRQINWTFFADFTSHCVILCFLLQTELAEQKKITEDYRAKLLGKNACGPFFNEWHERKVIHTTIFYTPLSNEDICIQIELAIGAWEAHYVCDSDHLLMIWHTYFKTPLDQFILYTNVHIMKTRRCCV